MKNEMLLYFGITLLLTFIIAAVTTRMIIPKLKSIKMGQKILDIGPRWHKSKEGTPTMGGIAFITAAALVFAAVGIYAYRSGFFGTDAAALACAAGLALLSGLIGLCDDYVKFVKKQNEGLRAWQKYLLQSLTAVIFLFAMTRLGYINTVLHIPFADISIDLGAAYYIIMFILITGVINSVNLNDGIDGLASSVTFVVAGFFAVVAFRTGRASLGFFSAIVIGCCLGFLLYNFHPAKIFMGDTGSLFLGGAVTGLAFLANEPLIIVTAGLIYIIESLSVIIQVSVFKLTPDHRRFFRMAPIHHHFERCGWSENKIVWTFSFVTLIMCVISYLAFA